MDYLYNITNGWKMLKEMPKLKAKDISNYDEPYRMYLYTYYGYIKELRKYDLESLSLIINDNNDNLFLLAAYVGNIKIMKYLESVGVNINHKNVYKLSAYLTAVYNGNIKSMKYLEQNGADIHHIDYQKCNAYLFAVEQNNLKIMKYLESRGLNIHLIDRIGLNAYLITGFCNVDIKIMKYLENIGININRKNIVGENHFNMIAYYYNTKNKPKYNVWCYKTKHRKLNSFKIMYFYFVYMKFAQIEYIIYTYIWTYIFPILDTIGNH